MTATGYVSQVTTAHLGEQGQMFLPKSFRESHHLEPGAPITVIEFGNQLILVPEEVRFAELSDSITRTLEQAGISENQLLEGLETTRVEIATERYPELFLGSESDVAGLGSIGTP